MFQVGEKVLYGIHGVCMITGTEERVVDRKRIEYLVLEPTDQEGTKYLIPSGNPTAIGKLNRILNADELLKLLSSDGVRENGWISEENQRKQTYRELIGSGDIERLARMVRALYIRKNSQLAAGKKFHQCDENFLRDAEKIIISEMTLVLEQTPEQARACLRENLLK